MKRRIPVGYGSASGGRGLAVFFLLWAGFLISRFYRFEGGREACKYIAAVAGILALLCILSDVTTNLKNRRKNRYMHDMLHAPYVVGEVTAVLPVHYRTHKVLSEEERRVTRAKYIRYVMQVTYQDPISGEPCTLTTEPYTDNPDAFLSGRRTEVHYNLDGHRWAEPTEYRTSQNEESIGANKRLNDAHFWLESHSTGISVAMFAAVVLILFLFLKITGA